jgi:hypothetical protein
MSEADRGRRGDDILRERRRGASPLSRWNGHRIVIVAIAWAGCILLLLALGTIASIVELHSLTEARIAFTRSNVFALVAVLVVPPAWLATQWWLMRGRRRASPAGRSSSE